MNSLSPREKKEIEDTNCITPINDNTLTPPIKKLYRKRDESRFSFAKSSNNKTDSNKENNIAVIKGTHQKEVTDEDEDSIVPDYVYDVICKKISRHTFFKKFDKYFLEKENQDFMFFEKDLKQNDSWSKFILSNMTIGSQNNKEKIK